MRSLLLSLASAVALLVTSAPQAHAEDLRVPNVAGQAKDQAVQVLRRAGFVPRVVDVAGPAVAKVAEQTPRAGAMLRRGGKVTIRVGIATRIRTAVPKVAGKSVHDAVAELTQVYDVRVKRVATTDPALDGKVLRSLPAAGKGAWFRAPLILHVGKLVTKPTPKPEPTTPEPTKSETGTPPASGGAPTTTADLPPDELPPAEVVRTGTAPAATTAKKTTAKKAPTEPVQAPPEGTAVTMPALAGKTEDEARLALERIGVRPTFLRVVDGSTKPGTVILSMPAAGSELESGDEAWVRIAKATPRVAQVPTSAGAPAVTAAPTGKPGEMPKLTGHIYPAPSQLLVKLGFLPKPTFVRQPGVSAWQIVAQEQPAGKKLPAGSVVGFSVALPRYSNGLVSMPYLYGLTAKQAREVLVGVGFALHARFTDVNGTVSTQTPAPGAQVGWGTHARVTIGDASDRAAVAMAQEVTLLELPANATGQGDEGGPIRQVGRWFSRLPGRIENLFK